MKALQVLRYRLLNLGHYTGNRIYYNSAFTVWLNCLLVIYGLREAFLLQWSDYLEETTFRSILWFLADYNKQVRKHRLRFYFVDQGVIITQQHNEIVRELVATYRKEMDSEQYHYLMGQILSYPAAGEILCGREPWLAGRKFYRIQVQHEYYTEQPLLVNVFYKEETFRRLEKLTCRLEKFFQQHEPHFRIYATTKAVPTPEPENVSKYIHLDYLGLCHRYNNPRIQAGEEAYWNHCSNLK